MTDDDDCDHMHYVGIEDKIYYFSFVSRCWRCCEIQLKLKMCIS
jgi:hypothetical protein